jgi:HAE1 family hydrophobic/amphiphilic exporter-1
MILLVPITIVATVWLLARLPKGFIPLEDTGQIMVITEGAQDASFETMANHQRAVAQILLKNPYVEAFSSSVGASGISSTSNSGRCFVRLKPRRERPSAEEIIAQLRPALAVIPGIRAYPQIPPLIRFGARSAKSPYQFSLSGVDLNELYPLAPKIEAKLRSLPQLADVTSDLQITNPQLFVKVNRDKASAVGLTAAEIEGALYNGYGSRQVSSIYTPTNQYFVILEIDPKYQGDPNALSMLYIRGGTGELVPLSSVAEISRTVGPLTVAHQGQLPSVTFSFNTRPGFSLGDASERHSVSDKGPAPCDD